jgi:hypothetical protein
VGMNSRLRLPLDANVSQLVGSDALNPVESCQGLVWFAELVDVADNICGG